MRMLSLLIILFGMLNRGYSQLLGDSFLKRVAHYCKAAKREYSLQDVSVVPGLTHYQDGREYRDYTIGIRKKIVTDCDTALLLDVTKLFCKEVLGKDTTVFNTITASLCTGNFKAESSVFNQPQLYRREQYQTQVFFDSICRTQGAFKRISAYVDGQDKVNEVEFRIQKKFLLEYLQFRIGMHRFFKQDNRLLNYLEKNNLNQKCADILKGLETQVKPGLANPLSELFIVQSSRKQSIMTGLRFLDTTLLKQMREAPTEAKVTKIIHWAVKKPLKDNFRYLTTQLVGDSAGFTLFNSPLYFKKETPRHKRKRLFKRIVRQFNHNRIWRWQSNDIRLLYSDRLKMIIAGGITFFK